MSVAYFIMLCIHRQYLEGSIHSILSFSLLMITDKLPLALSFQSKLNDWTLKKLKRSLILKMLNKFILPPVVAQWKYTYMWAAGCWLKCDVPLPRLQSAIQLLVPGQVLSLLEQLEKGSTSCTWLMLHRVTWEQMRGTDPGRPDHKGLAKVKKSRPGVVVEEVLGSLRSK